VSGAGTLYVVAGPIGNLGDLSPRAAEVLAAVAVVACEDTRTSRPLLERVGARGERVALHEHNETHRAPALVERLLAGDDVALLSDAGTPLVNDPGLPLVRLAAAAGLRVVPIPGPCAAVALLSAAGLPCERFLFLGFLPRAQAAKDRSLLDVAQQAGALVVYEAGNRTVDTLRAVARVLGPRQVVVGRELTKFYEELLRGTAAEVADLLDNRDEVKGEVAIAIAGADQDEIAARGLVERWAKADALIAHLRAADVGTRAIRDAVVLAFDLPRREVYARVLE
jgi:16S rRNA (cytidine1402-2'-O)-methyltransferase